MLPLYRNHHASPSIALPAPHPPLQLDDDLVLGQVAGAQKVPTDELRVAAGAPDLNEVMWAEVSEAGVVEWSHGRSLYVLITRAHTSVFSQAGTEGRPGLVAAENR